MSKENSKEIQANLDRAQESLVAAKELFENQHFDSCASRAYYAAFYTATALLLRNEYRFRKHSGVVAAVHERFVKTGKLDKKIGKDLSWLFELRSTADYGEIYHVGKDEAHEAIKIAESILQILKQMII